MDDQVTQVFRDGEQHRSLVFEIYEIYPASGLSTLGEKKKRKQNGGPRRRSCPYKGAVTEKASRVSTGSGEKLPRFNRRKSRGIDRPRVKYLASDRSSS